MGNNGNNWKRWERTVAKLFGGVRRGADVRFGHDRQDGRSGGKNDIRGRHDDHGNEVEFPWSIECKCKKKQGFQDILNACIEAEESRLNDSQCPVAVVKRPGDDFRNGLVVMRLEEFEKWFL